MKLIFKNDKTTMINDKNDKITITAVIVGKVINGKSIYLGPHI